MSRGARLVAVLVLLVFVVPSPSPGTSTSGEQGIATTAGGPVWVGTLDVRRGSHRTGLLSLVYSADGFNGTQSVEGPAVSGALLDRGGLSTLQPFLVPARQDDGGVTFDVPGLGPGAFTMKRALSSSPVQHVCERMRAGEVGLHSFVLANGAVHHKATASVGAWESHENPFNPPRAWVAGQAVVTRTFGPGAAGLPCV